MATGQRPGPDHLSRDHRASDDPSLFDRLVEKPQEHHLFQALRVIEAHYSDAPRLGESRRPREDRVRLGQEAELAFPPSTIASYKKGEHGKPDKLTNRFFGLFGPHGPLPLHITEYTRDRRRNHRGRRFDGVCCRPDHHRRRAHGDCWRRHCDCGQRFGVHHFR